MTPRHINSTDKYQIKVLLERSHQSFTIAPRGNRKARGILPTSPGSHEIQGEIIIFAAFAWITRSRVMETHSTKARAHTPSRGIGNPRYRDVNYRHSRGQNQSQLEHPTVLTRISSAVGARDLLLRISSDEGFPSIVIAKTKLYGHPGIALHHNNYMKT